MNQNLYAMASDISMTVLPETGGPGVGIYVLEGLLMITFAGLILLARRIAGFDR